MVDQQIICNRCGRRFAWTVSDQRFYAAQGYDPPKRCRDCRPARAGTAAPGRLPAAPVQAQLSPAPNRPRPAAAPRRTARRHPSPFRVFGAAALLVALALSALLLWYIPDAPLLAWLIAASAVAFVTYGYDKSIAGGDRLRVPEAVLLGLVLAGGAIGALLGMALFKHKTGREKAYFRARLWGIVALQLALLIAWLALRTIQ